MVLLAVPGALAPAFAGAEQVHCADGVQVSGLGAASDGVYIQTSRQKNGAPVYMRQDGAGYLYLQRPGSAPHRSQWAIQAGGGYEGAVQAREYAFGAQPWEAGWVDPIRMECLGGATTRSSPLDDWTPPQPPQIVNTGEIPRVGGSGTTSTNPVGPSTGSFPGGSGGTNVSFVPGAGGLGGSFPQTCALPQGLDAAPTTAQGLPAPESRTYLVSQNKHLPSKALADPRLNLEGEGTIEFWLKAEWDPAQVGDQNVTVLRYGSRGANAYVPWSIEVSPAKDTLILYMEDEVLPTSRETSVRFDDGAEHHVALTTDGSNTRLYVDGNLEDQWPVSLVKPKPDGHTLHLGESSFEGAIGRVRIWKRQLSDEEVERAQKPLAEITDRKLLVAYLDPGIDPADEQKPAKPKMVVVGGGSQRGSPLAGTWLSTTHPILDRYETGVDDLKYTFRFLPQTLLTTVPTSQGMWGH